MSAGPVRRAAIVAHSDKPEATRLRAELTAFLERRGVTVADDEPDLVVSLGGDGTLLRAAQVAHASDALLLGVNLGNMGYLTETDADGACGSLGRVLDGRFEVDERMMLRCDAGARSHVALNEVLVERTERVRLVRVSVAVGGERLAAFNADGVIVATPTGSTAYALSAGGPLVSPRARCLVVVPVSAHMISSRPFVFAPDETIELHLARDGEQASLALDGAIRSELQPGASVAVRRHDRPLRLVRLSGPAFLERLRTKLGLPG